MAQTNSPGQRLAAVIERRRVETGRTFRNLADETLIPLTTLHRRLSGDGFTLEEIARLAVVFDTTAADLMAEAERGSAA